MKHYIVAIILLLFSAKVISQTNADSTASQSAKSIQKNLNQYLTDNLGIDNAEETKRLKFENDSLLALIQGLRELPAQQKSQTSPVPTLIQSVYFKVGASTLNSQDKLALQSFAKNHQKENIVLLGFADGNGGDKVNLAICERRVKVVEDFLKSSGFSGQLKSYKNGKVIQGIGSKAAGSRRVDLLVYP